MGSGLQRVDKISVMTFLGKRVAAKVADYAKENQKLARDMARELDAAASAAEAAMLELKGHPLLAGVDVAARAWWVSRHLREARELCEGISAEMVKFNVQFRIEFIEGTDAEQRSTSKATYKGRVTI
ncbi:hypothetical protein AB0C74_39640 [Spirillospora sp. NPDC048832]